jgi:hypothetical protein
MPKRRAIVSVSPDPLPTNGPTSNPDRDSRNRPPSVLSRLLSDRGRGNFTYRPFGLEGPTGSRGLRKHRDIPRIVLCGILEVVQRTLIFEALPDRARPGRIDGARALALPRHFLGRQHPGYRRGALFRPSRPRRPVLAITASMGHPRFDPDPSDVCWSRGTVFIMGLSCRLGYWKQFRKPRATWPYRTAPG